MNPTLVKLTRHGDLFHILTPAGGKTYCGKKPFKRFYPPAEAGKACPTCKKEYNLTMELVDTMKERHGS